MECPVDMHKSFGLPLVSRIGHIKMDCIQRYCKIEVQYAVHIQSIYILGSLLLEMTCFYCI